MSDTLTHLLAVQDLDTSITQLEHRRDALGEASGLAGMEAELAELEARRVDAAARRAELTATQRHPLQPPLRRGLARRRSNTTCSATRATW